MLSPLQAISLFNLIKSFSFSVLTIITVLSNYGSFDPITKHINPGGLRIGREDFYNVNFWHGGPDRIAYNQQILKETADQNSLIKDFIGSGADVLVTYCDELKLGEKFWSITVNNQYYPDFRVNKNIDCVNDYDVEKNAEKIENKTIYLRPSEAERNELILSGLVKNYRITVGNY